MSVQKNEVVPLKSKKFFQLIPHGTSIDFIGKFNIFLTISLITVFICIVGMVVKGFNFGVDFRGGTVLQVRFIEEKSPEQVRILMKDLGEEDAVVVSGDEQSKQKDLNRIYFITLKGHQESALKKNSLSERLKEKVGASSVEILSSDVVGPKVGSELRAAALRSLIYSIILITIYIWFRFDFKFAPGATFAMLHDIIIAAGFYVFSGNEFNITAIAALLTIAGYSVNDTIVIYDRVRELIQKGGDTDLAHTINRAINLTLSRTMLTSGVTLISIIPISIFCRGEIQDFARAMILGIFVGTYSTVYVAAPLTVYVQKFINKK